MQDDSARELKFSDAEMIKIWLEAGISAVIPAAVFRKGQCGQFGTNEGRWENLRSDRGSGSI
jgi:hypothetical protein